MVSTFVQPQREEVVTDRRQQLDYDVEGPPEQWQVRVIVNDKTATGTDDDVTDANQGITDAEDRPPIQEKNEDCEELRRDIGHLEEEEVDVTTAREGAIGEGDANINQTVVSPVESGNEQWEDEDLGADGVEEYVLVLWVSL
jgi:hypothetical protein